MNTLLRKQLKVSLIGDDGIDCYQYGTVNRISAEAPVPVFGYSREVRLPGMAANVRENLTKLGVQVQYFHDLTCVKTRIIDEKFKHHLIRIDNDVECRPININDINFDVDAIVISDYNKGTVSYELVEEIIKIFQGPIFIDTKKTDLIRFSNSNVYVKINEFEFQNTISLCDNLIVTRGSNSVIFSQDKNKFHFPVKNVEVFDVCGAGDTFLSALAYHYLNIHDIMNAIQFAIRASSVTVQKIGVYAPTLEEI